MMQENVMKGSPTGAPLERRAYRFTGHVQGIGFRRSLSRAAQRLKLTGWVRNMADGSVEAEVQGPAAALDRLPSALRVAGPWIPKPAVRWTALPPVPGEESFRIRYDG